MKKVLVMAVGLMAAVLSTQAQDIQFGWDAGAELVGAYLWRGQYLGGLSIQPTASVGFDALDEKIKFRVGAWGSIGASDWKFYFNNGKADVNYDPNGGNPFTHFVPELDIFASVSAYGFSITATHYYYFGGTPFWAGLEDDGGSQTELTAGFNLGDIGPNINLFVNWSTILAGNDPWLNPQTQQGERAYSSYFEVGYTQPLPLDMDLTLTVGMTPWHGQYLDSESEDAFAVNNISLRYGKTFNFGDVCSLELFALGSINTHNITLQNCFVWAAGDNKIGTLQKLNGTIGVGVWF